ncbi:MAG: DUF1501 domain-containing protein [Gallionella sp.]|nr:DUF1501 domain-containing protein [Gallionella sp.]
MTEKINFSRREFLRRGSLLSVAGSLSAPFALNLFSMNVAAASTFTSDYKAIVCLYFGGGNDSANMVLATDTPSWSGYQAARSIGGAASIALPMGSLLPITPNTPHVDAVGSRSFSLHPNLTQLKSLFDAGRAAVIANVGTLVEPIADKVAYRSNAIQKPDNLFSHSDQTTQWHSTDPAKPIYGWGGRMGDVLKASNSKQNFTSISSSGNSVFLAGETINQYQINANGAAVPIGGMTNLFGINAANNPLHAVITNTAASNFIEREHAAVVERSIAAQTDLNNVMLATATSVASPTQYLNPNNNQLANNSLATQLKTVARIIEGQVTLGAHRQVFFVSIGGFDTHDNQLANQADLMARIAHAVSYFDGVLATLPVGDMSNKVTLFTASDFGRTFTSNGDGTDHGWGAHHFVVGGAVKGKDIYGSFPQSAVTNTSAGIDNPLDVGSGSLIPTISVDQYAGTLAKWFGLSTAEIATVFPNLAKFSTQDLGFMA